MKGTLTIDGVTVDIQLTDEQINQVKKAIEPKEKKITWEELGEVAGYSIASAGEIELEVQTPTWGYDIFKTKNQARAAIAMAKLSHLMAHEYYNGDWRPDLKDDNWKQVIAYYGGNICRDKYMDLAHFLTFKDEETRDRFFSHHRELIEEYFLLYQ